MSLTGREVQRVIEACGLKCEEELAEASREYLRLIYKWNQRMNLTAIEDPGELLRTLFAESFYGADLLGAVGGPILDIGSGAGFPGLAIKLRRPDLAAVLVEPRQKRCAFLAAVVRELKIPGVKVLNRTLEQCQPADFSDAPAVVTLRAVGRGAELVSEALRIAGARPKVLLFLSRDQAPRVQAGLRQFQWRNEPLTWNARHCLLLGTLL